MAHGTFVAVLSHSLRACIAYVTMKQANLIEYQVLVKPRLLVIMYFIILLFRLSLYWPASDELLRS